jgi:hypothetical protein
MGIGRENFKRMADNALEGSDNDPLKAVAIHNNVYLNRKLGILIHKPAEWGFIAIQDFGRLKSDQIIGNGLELDPEEIWEMMGNPKYFEDKPEYRGVFSPTITLQVTPKSELDPEGDLDFEDMIEKSMQGTSLILMDFRLIRRHEPYLISGCLFHEFDAEYLFEHVEIQEPLKVELKSLKAEYNGLYYDFNCHQSKAQNQVADEEFEQFKKNIVLM